MSTETQQEKTILWSDAIRVGTAARVAGLLKDRLEIVRAGGPPNHDIRPLMDIANHRSGDDLRQMIHQDQDASVLLLASMEDISPAVVKQAMTLGMQVITLAPLTVDFEGSTELFKGAPLEHRADLAPAFARSTGWRQAANPTEPIGAVRLITVTQFGSRESCSLYARLADAWRTVLQIGGMPQSITACLSPVDDAQPDTLRQLTGTLSVQARLGQGAAVLQLSDQSSPHDRRVEVVGELGRLHVSDLGYELFNQAGAPVDEGDSALRLPADYALLAAEDIRRLIDQPEPSLSAHERSVIEAQVLACCLTTMLSTRTDQPEIPGKWLEMYKG